MWSWRYSWKYMPIFRNFLYSGLIVYGVIKFVLPSKYFKNIFTIYYYFILVKPRHKIQYAQAVENAHHHEVEKFYGYRQKVQDALYFKKYNPLKKEGEIDVSGHH